MKKHFSKWEKMTGYHYASMKKSDNKLVVVIITTTTIIIIIMTILAKEQYVKRYDKVSAQIHFNICKEIGVQLDKITGMSMYQNQ